MAMELNFFEPEAHYEADGNLLLKQRLSPVAASMKVSESDNSCFECNICLESAHDPVVTLCGHLYCWPCIYKWLHVQSSSLDADQKHQNCPVCKASISVSSLVPLYGHGTSSSESVNKKGNSDVVVPCRPQPSLLNTSITSATSTMNPTPQLHPSFFQSEAPSVHNPPYFPNHYGGYAAIASSSLGGMATISFVNPLMGMFGGMAMERIFGSAVTSLLTHPSPHPLMVSDNPRVRRQEVEIDKSLNRFLQTGRNLLILMPTFCNLKHLELTLIDSKDAEVMDSNVGIIASLLRCSPGYQSLHITFFKFNFPLVPGYCKRELNAEDLRAGRLKWIEMKLFPENKNQVELVRLFVASLEVLEKIKLHIGSQ